MHIDGPKSPPPARSLRLLGALLHSGCPAPHAELPPSRRQELIALCEFHLATGHISPAQAASLRGKLGFARSLFWGRYGAAALRPLKVRQEARCRADLPDTLRACLLWWTRELKTNSGRPFPPDPADLPLHVTVSDGEGSGSVAVGWWQPRNPAWTPLVTQATVPAQWQTEWAGTGQAQHINAIEAAGPALALASFPGLAAGLWIHFVDNTAAEHALVRGGSGVHGLNLLTYWTWSEARQRTLYLWVARVASKDNPVDQLSRGVREDLYAQGWQHVPPLWPEIPHPW